MAHAERAWERELTQQRIDVSRAEVEDLLEAPVLLLGGTKLPKFDAENAKKLRMYVDRGGSLFVVGGCEAEFDREFRRLITAAFPETEHRLQLLAADHPVWFAERPVVAAKLPELWGVDVGCRTGVIYCPTPLGCYWELDHAARTPAWPAAVREQVTAARNVGLNVLTYATNRTPKFKSPQLAPDRDVAKPEVVARGTLRVASLRVAGDCSATTMALARLMEIASQLLEVRAEAREVGLNDPELFDYHMVFLHGRTDFEWTSAERMALRTYLERGGLLFADAVCSSTAFRDALQREMKHVLPNHVWTPIPTTHPLLSTNYGGADLRTVEFRLPNSAAAGAAINSSRTRGVRSSKRCKRVNYCK
ncbi:MAG: DUF4159 domain-containing protein [Pirellulales bacterium]